MASPPLQKPLEIRQRIWQALARASQDRHHAWRTPVLATVGRDGAANARTVVLRHADAAAQTLRIYTDRRSPKLSEIATDPHAMFVFWSARLNWQLRAKVAITVDTAGPQLDALWQKVRQSAAAADYLGPEAPGSPCQQAQSGCSGPELDPRPDPGPEHQLAVLNAQVLEMDWLELGRGGHRRACLLADSWQWLTP